MRLKDKVAVITGGAGGMGLATVERFLAEGAKVVIADFNDATGAKALSDLTAAGFGANARFIKTDVAKEADVAAAVALAVSEFGGLDIIFNNAGVGGAIGPVWELEEAEWDYTFDVLVKGVFFGIKHATRHNFPESLWIVIGSAAELEENPSLGSPSRRASPVFKRLAPKDIHFRIRFPAF